MQGIVSRKAVMNGVVQTWWRHCLSAPSFEHIYLPLLTLLYYMYIYEELFFRNALSVNPKIAKFGDYVLEKSSS